MKYTFLVLSCLVVFFFSACKDHLIDVPFVAPDCVQTIIDDFQENDVNPSCITAVRHYLFEGATVFEVQDDNCIDGIVTIMDMECNTICTLTSTGFTASFECGASTNFYDDARLVGVLWEEEN